MSDAQARTFEMHTDAHKYVQTFQMSFQSQAENLSDSLHVWPLLFQIWTAHRDWGAAVSV